MSRCLILIVALHGDPLYEVLEAYVNRRGSNFTVSIEDLRSRLKASENATSYSDWKDLKRRVIDPAVDEINEHGADGSFIVSYQGIREGKTFTKIKFTLVKSLDRDDHDK